MHCDWSFLAELLFGFVHLADEVYEALSRLWNTLFGPVDELELPHRPRLAVSRVGHLQNQQRLDQVAAFFVGGVRAGLFTYLELSQDVLGHVVLRNRINHKAVVPH